MDELELTTAEQIREYIEKHKSQKIDTKKTYEEVLSNHDILPSGTKVVNKIYKVLPYSGMENPFSKVSDEELIKYIHEGVQEIGDPDIYQYYHDKKAKRIGEKCFDEVKKRCDIAWEKMDGSIKIWQDAHSEFCDETKFIKYPESDVIKAWKKEEVEAHNEYHKKKDWKEAPYLHDYEEDRDMFFGAFCHASDAKYIAFSKNNSSHRAINEYFKLLDERKKKYEKFGLSNRHYLDVLGTEFLNCEFKNQINMEDFRKMCKADTENCVMNYKEIAMRMGCQGRVSATEEQIIDTRVNATTSQGYYNNKFLYYDTEIHLLATKKCPNFIETVKNLDCIAVTAGLINDKTLESKKAMDLSSYIISHPMAGSIVDKIKNPEVKKILLQMQLDKTEKEINKIKESEAAEKKDINEKVYE